MFAHPRAQQLLDIFTTAVAHVFYTFHVMGLPINLAPTKTAAILSFIGPGSSSAQDSILVDRTSPTTPGAPQRWLPIRDTPLPVVRSYTYLGTVFNDASTFTSEVKHR
eukprot:3160108-Prorocentrum_lima.AAC.1